MTLLSRLFLIACVISANGVYAQAWPAKQITIVVPFAPGGNIDIVGRTVGKELSKILQQTVIIENKPGAGGMVGATYVAKSKPDGYTFLVSSNGLVTTTLIRNDQQHKDEELVPITLLTIAPSVIIANNNNPAANLKEFIANVKASKDNRVVFATAGVGTTPHFVSALFKIASDIEVEPIPYKSGIDTVTALVGNQVQLAAESTQVVTPKIKAGMVKALAVTYDQRSSSLPDVPTTKELGYPSIFITHFVGMMAPAGTPVAILEKMSQANQKALQSPEVKSVFNNAGTIVVGGSRASFAEYLQKERERLKAVVLDAKMTQ
ncbi:tripartite tricarboxylate transporter substrate binding protein [Polynucleobacter sp. AP-Melu-500A-A1]|uniref:Bug family tripartite tricarboxylate transporter substrate binding protein n=1 Tax=Polynucleobacter sp. AP-Melu-500A-A1 TaxID=2576929 RepID=UPI001C0BA73F|nr:tripartite tricarboxylate transporter substrate binding protein [Polynucleobacter sp. AP-Melu-500A-A1]MBU3631457.1 tripartite tricarboxylate transporter substrate binding protein [Polynucleobacter sp. AP-Melu-500A-A1]